MHFAHGKEYCVGNQNSVGIFAPPNVFGVTGLDSQMILVVLVAPLVFVLGC